MRISYYPGCTLKTQAKELDRYARASAQVLGVEMDEIENWQCCGGVYNTSRDEIATKLSALRALEQAKRNGGKLLTLCSACHNVIKRVNDDAKNDENFCAKANAYLSLALYITHLMLDLKTNTREFLLWLSRLQTQLVSMRVWV